MARVVNPKVAHPKVAHACAPGGRFENRRAHQHFEFLDRDSRGLLGLERRNHLLDCRFLSEEELRAAIVLFYSLLDEQQRRLYARLESTKQGHGGDRMMSQTLGLDVETVARGRRELLSGEVQLDRVRRAGGGRPRVEKKRQTS